MIARHGAFYGHSNSSSPFTTVMNLLIRVCARAHRHSLRVVHARMERAKALPEAKLAHLVARLSKVLPETLVKYVSASACVPSDAYVHFAYASVWRTHRCAQVVLQSWLTQHHRLRLERQGSAHADAHSGRRHLDSWRLLAPAVRKLSWPCRFVCIEHALQSKTM